ncbi:Cytochrome oxidase assembly [Steccherinum ochraceum]|uniref:Cytochrome c oxidase assembly protein COX16, mitochondrial n=1 Tax=Steccherinum ochraceum TaxID=92696 RepID=A0A4R0RVL0_9APHY|nr:Cytochrome oxidase assembly [Steccherinum ochraceum]
MPVFPSNPLNASPFHRNLRRHPAYFGVPFILLMVGASYGLQTFTQTRYDLQDQKVHAVKPEDELSMKKKRKFDIREEYFRLSSAQEDEWESKRIARPKGLPEWGDDRRNLAVAFPYTLRPPIGLGVDESGRLTSQCCGDLSRSDSVLNNSSPSEEAVEKLRQYQELIYFRLTGYQG